MWHSYSILPGILKESKKAVAFLRVPARLRPLAFNIFTYMFDLCVCGGGWGETGVFELTPL